ncbi:hypothetical protein SAMN05444671_0023 [Flavobacterium sp. CF108]|uniref:hypothetical protein n=1 Tax=unclassified Flavobacterium TaxID=196869 RepID=UPI0008B43143|nr:MULTISPECIES: hypothetical protein [unclassified Flavobacterium]SEP32799.1 hypothetical protein SAMN04487978_0593 [Flavobacterium sp. fv08]SHI03784.1 hypothetical protein SAMN05444671_0023 [Flavobacterium sp. CF108]
MTIIKRNRILFIVIIFFGCSTQKQSKNDICKKVNIESEDEYNGNNQIILNNFSDFNSKSNKVLDIIRVSSTTGYEHKENFKRIFIEDNKVFIIEDNKTTQEANLNSKQLQESFLKCNEIKSLINCTSKKSQNYLYRFFVKKENKIVMTFTANNQIKNIDSDLIKEELFFINFFEKIK